MFLRTEILPEKKLVGKRLKMSLVNNRTPELWRSFIQQMKEAEIQKGGDLYSVQLYPPFYYSNFNPATEFEKWAACELVTSALPAEWEEFSLPSGLYAVFLHKGAAPTAAQTFQYIFGTWLPSSAYQLDHRPHFEKLGEKYKNNDPASEEEIWIPVKEK